MYHPAMMVIWQVSNKKEVLERYGNAAVADTPDESLLLGQTEAYVEYDASGTLPLLVIFCMLESPCSWHSHSHQAAARMQRRVLAS
jgi:hypothetical protein